MALDHGKSRPWKENASPRRGLAVTSWPISLIPFYARGVQPVPPSFGPGVKWGHRAGTWGGTIGSVILKAFRNA